MGIGLGDAGLGINIGGWYEQISGRKSVINLRENEESVFIPQENGIVRNGMINDQRHK